MTEKQYNKVLEASQPVPMIALQCGTPRSAQEKANQAWKKLGDEMGFKYMTTKPGPDKLTFYAEPLQEVTDG